MEGCIQTPATQTRPPGHWEPNVMPFGLSNARATFQEFINEVLKDLIATGLVLVYLNDILIATPHDLPFLEKLSTKSLRRWLSMICTSSLKNASSNREPLPIWD
jgi:hypothetical protein